MQTNIILAAGAIKDNARLYSRYRILFIYKLDPMPIFKAYVNVKNLKFGPFLRASEEGKKNDHNVAKIKVRSNFI